MADVSLHTRPEVEAPAAGFKLAGDDGTQTALVDVDNLPISAAVAEALAQKASLDSLEAVQASVNASLDTKYDSTDLADQATAEAGTDNTKLMTALRTAQQIAAQVPALTGSTTETMATTQWLMVSANAVGSTSVATFGCTLTLLDSSSNTAAQAVDGNFKRCLYRAQASGLNRAAGALTGNGNLRLTGPGAETTIALGIADASFADGSVFGGLYEGTGTPAWTTTNPSAITSCAFIGAGCDETDDNWQVMWRSNTGSVTKVDTGIPRERHRPMMVYIRPNDDATSVFVRVTKLSNATGRELTSVPPSKFEHTITTNIFSAGVAWGRAWVRSSLSGVAQDGVTGFQSDLMFSNCFGGRVPLLNYADVDPDPVPDNRTVTGADTIIGTDIGAIVNFNSASTAALTLPSDATLGFTEITAPLQVFIKGAGVPTITAGSGVTILGTPPVGLAQNKFLVLCPTGEANTWAYV